MEVKQPRLHNRAMTFDEVSIERSKSFVKALQELKNLRPQLYSAAEYCERSYLHSEQKQMVLDNLKDYAVRALVNAVDHLGTVAYKLTDLLEQQTSDVSTVELKISCMNQQVYITVAYKLTDLLEQQTSDVSTVELKISCMNQQLLTCQTYSNKEGLRQQQLLAVIPRHHKHYILPNSVNKKVHFSPRVQTRLQPTGILASKTLSWHLASETKSTLRGTQQPLPSTESCKTSGVFHLLDNEENRRTKSSAIPAQVSSGGPASNAIMQTFGVGRRDAREKNKILAAFRSFDNPRHEIIRAPVRSKSVLSTFFVKQKTPKLKAGYVS